MTDRTGPGATPGQPVHGPRGPAGGRSWIVTGASRGIGRLVTEALLARGDRVAATVRKPDALTSLTSRYGDRLHVDTLDVSDPAQVREVIDRAFAALGHVDVVLSNAGYGIYGAAEEATDDQVERIVATNLVGSMQVARAVVPYFRDRGAGHLIQMSSMAGHIGAPGFSLYHATKWGIEGFFEALAAEVRPFGMRTTVLAPGRFPTGFAEAADRTEAQAAYAGNTHLVRGTSDAPMPGDVGRLVELIVSIGGTEDPPGRLLLGSDAYALTHDALTARLRDLEGQWAVAMSTDA